MNPLPLLLGGGLVLGLVLASGHNASAAGAALVPGHRYKFTFRANVSKTGTPYAALNSLTTQLAELGWSAVLLEPSSADVDQFVWRATGLWTGLAPALRDSGTIKFLGTPTNLDAIPQAHKYDQNLPPELELTVDRMLASENDPNQLRTFAQSLTPDYPIAVNQLTTKANAISFSPPNSPPPVYPPAPPIVVPPQPPPQVTPAPPPAPPAYVPPAYQPVYQPPPPPPDAPGVVTLPEITIVGNPNASPAWMPSSPLPPLPSIPAHLQGYNASTATEQRALSNWNTATGVLDAMGYGIPNADGMIGPITQAATQLFQAWSNANRGTSLDLDGLFGKNTNAALFEWGG